MFPGTGVMFEGVIYPKSRSSSISRIFQHLDPHPRERRSLVLQVHLSLPHAASSKCFLCKWMELGWEAATLFWIVVFLADDFMRRGQLKMRCLFTQPSCSCLHGPVSAAPAEGVCGCRGAVAAGASPTPHSCRKNLSLGSAWESGWLFTEGTGEERGRCWETHRQQHPFKVPLLTGTYLSHHGPARGTFATLLG